MSQEDIDVLARTLWGEARGEPLQGKIAVANVIVNRLKKGKWGRTIAAVCQRPKQFSCWNPGDANRKKLDAVTISDPVFAECVVVAKLAVVGLIKDNTDGADHYNTLSCDPAWDDKMVKTAVIGNHEFFKE